MLSLLGLPMWFQALLILGMYVATALAYRKVLVIIGYKDSWLAWVPYLSYYALADAAIQKGISRRVKLSPVLMKFWWLVSLLLMLFTDNRTALAGNTILQIGVLGTVFGYIYSLVTNRKLEEVRGYGYASGLIEVIAVLKFLAIKESTLISEDFNDDEYVGSKDDNWSFVGEGSSVVDNSEQEKVEDISSELNTDEVDAEVVKEADTVIETAEEVVENTK